MQVYLEVGEGDFFKPQNGGTVRIENVEDGVVNISGDFPCPMEFDEFVEYDEPRHEYWASIPKDLFGVVFNRASSYSRGRNGDGRI